MWRKRAKRNEATGLPMATTPSVKWFQNEQKQSEIYKELCANQTHVDISQTKIYHDGVIDDDGKSALCCQAMPGAVSLLAGA